jgi:hypothetical protein
MSDIVEWLLKDAADTITRLTAEVAEYEATFDAAWEADMRGVQMWREAHPGNDMVLPDRANFTSWILAEIMRLRSLTVVQETLIRKAEAENEKLREALEAALENGVGVSYSCDEDGCGNYVCCGEVSYKPHAPDCWTLKTLAALSGDKQ